MQKLGRSKEKLNPSVKSEQAEVPAALSTEGGKVVPVLT